MAQALKDGYYLSIEFYKEHARWPALVNTRISIPELVKCTAEVSLGILIAVAYHTWNLEGAKVAQAEFRHFGRILYETEEAMKSDRIYTLIIAIFIERSLWGFIPVINVLLGLNELLAFESLGKCIAHTQECASSVIHALLTCNDCGCRCTLCETCKNYFKSDICWPFFQRFFVVVPSLIFGLVLVLIVWIPDISSFKT